MAFRRGGSAAAASTETSRQPVEGQPERGSARVKFNVYPGRCLVCDQWVEADGGGIMKNDEGRWKPVHFAGECPEPTASTVTSVEAQVVAEEERPGVQFRQSLVGDKVVFDGDYTIDLGDRHRTFRLATQSTDDEFMPGKQLIAYLSGPDNEADYVRFGHIDERSGLRVWKRHQDNAALVADAKTFWADPHAENVLAATRCYRCGRELTVPASIHNGLGPECSKKGF